MGGLNDDELIDLLEFGTRNRAEVRFIEYMDVGGALRWSRKQVFTASEMLEVLSRRYGRIETVGPHGSAPAERFRLPDGRTFGIIASTTQPFCGACDRSRLTADGQWFTCLYSSLGTDLKAALRAGSDVEALIRSAWERRSDRGAEQRLQLRERGPLASASELRREPHLEMHTRGG